jgi:hypothetical protein
MKSGNGDCPDRERRLFLRTMGIAGAVGIAGCAGIGGDDQREVPISSVNLIEVDTESEDAEFDAVWSVSDDDGDLSSVELTLTNLETGEQMDTQSVSDGSSHGKTRLIASGQNGRGYRYQAEFLVTHSDGQTATETARVTESESSTCDSPVRPYSEEPRYWEYNGQPVTLIGGDQQDNPFQYIDSDDDYDAIAWLDTLASLGGNFARNVISDRDAEKFGTDNVYAFENTGSGYDLTRFNVEYFDRLDAYLAAAQSREIIVSIELWDGWDLYGERWDSHPWNPANNINYSETTTLNASQTDDPLEEMNPFFQTVPRLNDDSTVLQYQEAFIQRVLDVTLQYDNVIYLPHNERRGALEWSLYWGDFIREAAADVERDVHVGEMNDADDHGSVQPSLVHDVFDFTDVSQHSERSGEAHFDELASSWDELAGRPMPMNAVKNYGCGDDGAAMVWRCLMAGAAAARYHRGPFGDCDWGIGLQDKAKVHLETQRLVLNAVGGAYAVQSHQEVNHLIENRDGREVYMMADPGRVYAVYFKEAASVELDVSDVSGDVTVEWRDIERRSWVDPETLSGDVVTLTAPQFGHSVAVIRP